MRAITLKMFRKIAAAGRESLLTDLIRQYAKGEISDKELERALIKLYNRSGESRTTQTNAEGEVPSVLGVDPLYRQVYDLITEHFPKKEELRPEQLESYTNTVSARAVTTERLAEYQNRGVEYVEVVAYLDEATTDICRMMNGRVFPVGEAGKVISNQEVLVQSEQFWQGNHYFAQSSTPEMVPWLPPYHYNCRTRVVPFVEPSDPLESAMVKYNNLLPMREKDIEAIANYALGLEFANREKLLEKYNKHKKDMGVNSVSEYQNLLVKLLKNPLKNVGLAISARDKALTLYVWDPKVRRINETDYHDFGVFSLDQKRVKTFYPKTMQEIMLNFDSHYHRKIKLIAPNKIYKGNKMVTEYDVRCYEYILDYLETDDSTDEIEILCRLFYDKYWDEIEPELKKRILAVDKIVLEKYADLFSYPLWQEYIAKIRGRINGR